MNEEQRGSNTLALFIYMDKLTRDGLKWGIFTVVVSLIICGLIAFSGLWFFGEFCWQYTLRC